MKTSRRFLMVALSVSCALLGSCSSIGPRQSLETLWNAPLIPCGFQTCGGFPQNTATLRLEAGEVLVAATGAVTVRLRGLTLASGVIAAHKTLEVWMGSFTSGVFEGSSVLNPLGTVTTDAQGNFDGAIRGGSGAAFAFAPGTTVSGQFALNEPSVRTEFVTGFSIR